jgi:WXG100 family type VII secretion target
MAAGYIKVTPAELYDASSRLSGGAAAIEGQLRALEGVVAGLGAGWAGLAQARFQELFAQWQRSATTLHAALLGISQLTGQAGRAYEDSEQAIAGSFVR